MRRDGFRGCSMGIRGHGLDRGMEGFRRPYGRSWARPYRSFMWWRPFWWYPLWWRPLYWMPWTMLMGGFMYLLYDSIAYKLHRNDVERIERDMGKSAADLSEGELVASMKRLGIYKLEITPEDRETIVKSKQPVKELSKEEIVAAMTRLGITKLEVTSAGQRVTRQLNNERPNHFCIYCGNRLSANGLYCSKCGKRRTIT